MVSKKVKLIKLCGYIFICFFLSRLIMYIWGGFNIGNWGVRNFFLRMNTFDAAWYKGIAENGYTTINDNGQASWAFFPLCPIMVRVIAKIIPVDMEIIASVLNTIISAVAMFVLYKYILLTRGSECQGKILIFLYSFGAYSFYFSIFYTEALYFLLLICCFYFLKTERYVLMGISGALLSLTRNTGIFFVFVILCYCIQEYTRKSNDIKIRYFITDTLKNYRLVLGTFLVPLGFFGFMFYLKRTLGDAFAFAHVQVAWGKKIGGNVFSVLGKAMFNTFPPSYLCVVALFSVLIILLSIFKFRRFDEAIMPVVTFLLSASISLNSIPRYMWGSCFVMVALTDELVTIKRKYVVYAFLVGNFIFELMCIRAWLQYNPQLT